MATLPSSSTASQAVGPCKLHRYVSCEMRFRSLQLNACARFALVRALRMRLLLYSMTYNSVNRTTRSVGGLTIQTSVEQPKHLPIEASEVVTST